MTGFLQVVTLFIIAGLALLTVFTVPRGRRQAAAPLVVGCWALVAVFACWQLYLHWFHRLTTPDEITVSAQQLAEQSNRSLFYHVPPQPGSVVGVRVDREGDFPISYTRDWIENEEATMAAGALCALLTIAFGAYRLRKTPS